MIEEKVCHVCASREKYESKPDYNENKPAGSYVSTELIPKDKTQVWPYRYKAIGSLLDDRKKKLEQHIKG